MPIFMPSLCWPVAEKNWVWTMTPKSTANALAVECQIFDEIYLAVAPKENQSTRLRA